uniref:DDE Tnp4 domain-containing protein n=2 Tax=Schizaphis graminum TaxID=13262 RepID=A0A2S2PLY9_SCHGA
MTGIPSHQILNKIVELFSLQYPDVRAHQLSIKERIVLVFIKLKQDLSFSVLSVLFNSISVSSCRSIYLITVPILHAIFDNLIFWPSKAEIMANIPYCFKNFVNVRVILDCTEVPVQKPKCLSCRIKLYSLYKSGFTLKFMIGVSPAGLITFVSNSYGGRASDSIIFKQSNLIQLLDRYDAIMVDRGFLIDDECNEKGVTLIRPPFLKGKHQFSKSEALLTKDIAAARVHIERVNQRIKTFKIFQNKFGWGHAHLAHAIMVIICGISNLSSPIFSPDKFI